MKKNPKCPKCGADETIPIIYGLPTPDMGEKYARGEVILGGCMVTDGIPIWHCKGCKNEWGEFKL